MKWRVYFIDWTDEMVDELFQFLVDNTIKHKFTREYIILDEPEGSAVGLLREGFDRICIVLHEFSTGVQS